jgi:hypothetical protein
MEETVEKTIPEYNLKIAFRSAQQARQGDPLSNDPHQVALGNARLAVQHADPEVKFGSVSNMAISAAYWESANPALTTFDFEQATHVRFIRDLFGNPFRQTSFEPNWLTPNVIDLAQTIYQDRSFENMPMLADALMDAGCNNDDILEHCRLPNEHIRGCWVLDQILGKS